MAEVPNTDLSKILDERHFGKWIALSKDYSKIVGYSDTFKELEKKLGREGVVYMRAPQKNFVYAFRYALSVERI